MARVDLLGSVNVITGILYSEATKASIPERRTNNYHNSLKSL